MRCHRSESARPFSKKKGTGPTLPEILSPFLPPGRLVVVGFHLEVRESKIAIRVADAIIEPNTLTPLLIGVVPGGYHFHAVTVSLDDIANNCRLYDVPIFDS